MRNIIAVFLLFLFLTGFLNINLSVPVMADEHFDSYRNTISWEEEITHLDNFAIYLRRNPEMIGYIAFYTSKKDSLSKVKARINRAKKYLVKQRKIEEERIVIIYAGELDNSITILQPIDKKSPPPKFGFPNTKLRK